MDILSLINGEIDSLIQSTELFPNQKVWLEDYQKYLKVLRYFKIKQEHLRVLRENSILLLEDLTNLTDNTIRENKVKRLFIEIILKLFNTSIREFRNIYEAAVKNVEDNSIGSCLALCIIQKLQNIKELYSSQNPLNLLINSILSNLDFIQTSFVKVLGNFYLSKYRENEGLNQLIKEIFSEPGQFLYYRKCNKYISETMERLVDNDDVEQCYIDVLENNTKVYELNEYGVYKEDSRKDKFITIGSNKKTDIFLGNQGSTLCCIIFNAYSEYFLRYTSKRNKFEAFFEIEPKKAMNFGNEIYPGNAVKFENEICLMVNDAECEIKIGQQILLQYNINGLKNVKKISKPNNGVIIEIKSSELFNQNQEIDFGIACFNNEFLILALKGILKFHYSSFDAGNSFKCSRLFPNLTCEATIKENRVTNLSDTIDCNSITAHFLTRRLTFIKK